MSQAVHQVIPVGNGGATQIYGGWRPSEFPPLQQSTAGPTLPSTQRAPGYALHEIGDHPLLSLPSTSGNSLQAASRTRRLQPFGQADIDLGDDEREMMAHITTAYDVAVPTVGAQRARADEPYSSNAYTNTERLLQEVRVLYMQTAPAKSMLLVNAIINRLYPAAKQRDDEAKAKAEAERLAIVAREIEEKRKAEEEQARLAEEKRKEEADELERATKQRAEAETAAAAATGSGSRLPPPGMHPLDLWEWEVPC